MDGIDAALVRVRGSGEDTEVRIEDFICREYSDAARNLLLSPGSLNAGVRFPISISCSARSFQPRSLIFSEKPL